MTQDIQLDEINENDLLDALSGIQGDSVVTVEGSTLPDTSNETATPEVEDNSSISNTNTNTLQLTSSSDDVVSFLKQLLNGKTLEISIKIKD